MIKKPAQHNTTHPAGQIVNPVGVVSPTKQVKDLASEISDFHLHTDGCCHKTRMQLCPECPFKDMKGQ